MGAAHDGSTARNSSAHNQSREARRQAFREEKRRMRAWLAQARRDGRVPDGPGPDHTIRVQPLPVPVKRTSLTGTHTRASLRARFRTLTKGVLLPLEPEDMPEEFRIREEDCGGFLVDIISRARAHWLLNVPTIIGYWAAAAYHGLPYWCDDAPVVLLGSYSSGDARSWNAEHTPTVPVFLAAVPSVTTVCPDSAFPHLRVVTANIAAGQCLHSLLKGTHGWDVPEVPGLTPREVRCVQFLDAMFQCTRLTGDDVRRGARNLVDAGRLDRLLALSDPGAQSPRETLLRLYVRDVLPAGFTWTSQVTVYLDPAGRPWKHLIADLACEELTLALFYDGAYHRAEERRNLDHHQIARLRKRGWEAVRVDAALMAETDLMMEDIGDAIERALAARPVRTEPQAR